MVDFLRMGAPTQLQVVVDLPPSAVTDDGCTQGTTKGVTMADIAEATRAAGLLAGDVRDRPVHRREGGCRGRRPQTCAVPVQGSGFDSARSAPTPARSMPMLLAELVELGREAWRITERERAVRAELEALREIGE